MKRPLFLIFTTIIVIITIQYFTDKINEKRFKNDLDFVVFHRHKKSFYIDRDDKKVYLPKFKKSIYLPTILSYDWHNGYVLFIQGGTEPVNLTKESMYWIGSVNGYQNLPLYIQSSFTISNGYIYYVNSVDKNISLRKTNIKTNKDSVFLDIKNTESISIIKKLCVTKNYILILGEYNTKDKVYVYDLNGNLICSLSDIGDIKDIVIDDYGYITYIKPDPLFQFYLTIYSLTIYSYSLKERKTQKCSAFQPRINLQFNYSHPRINITSRGDIVVWFFVNPLNEVKTVIVKRNKRLKLYRTGDSFTIGEERILPF